MSENKHNEPWTVQGMRSFKDRDGDHAGYEMCSVEVADFLDVHDCIGRLLAGEVRFSKKERWKRIVSCVNLCAGKDLDGCVVVSKEDLEAAIQTARSGANPTYDYPHLARLTAALRGDE